MYKLPHLDKLQTSLDTLHLTKIDINFLSNLIDAWDLDSVTPSYDNMHAISRLCDSIYESISKCEEEIKSHLEKKEEVENL